MDDFVINVRQIAQYPTIAVGPNDLLLVQQGGLGGPYAAATVGELLQGSLNAGPLSTPGQISAANFVLPDGGHLGWGDSGSLSFSPATGFTFAHASSNGLFSALMRLNADGSAQLPFSTLQVARDPFQPFEVATQNYVTNNTVASFNGRTGVVTLSTDDLSDTLGGTPATQDWVNALLCQSIPDFIYNNPFVYTFNGRVGDITLTIADVESAFFAQPGTYPTAPTPPLNDMSKRIATTEFIDNALVDLHTTINSEWNAADYQLLNLITTQYAPLNSPVFTGVPTAPMPPLASSDATIATTAWVMQHVTAAVTGVASFNTRTGAVVFTAADLASVNGATLNSPIFTGVPTVPLAPSTDNSAQIASTAWVQQEISAISAGVTSWNGRSGIVNLQAADLTLVGGALLASPAFSGNPTAPTQPPGTNNTTLATTAFVTANIGVATFNGRTGAVSLQLNDITAAQGAPIANPAFTGVPTAPTAPPGTSTTQLATTQFVMSQLAGANVVTTFNTRTGNITLTLADVTGAGGAPIASPALTGTPTAPTPAQTDNSTSIATTAFVDSAAPIFARGWVNKLRNGAFQINQRGASGTASGSVTYCSDGWILNCAAGGSASWAIIMNNPFGGWALRVTLTAGAYVGLIQRIESAIALSLTNYDLSYAPIMMQIAIFNPGTNPALIPKLSLYVASAQDNFANINLLGTVTCNPIAPGTYGIAAGVIIPSQPIGNGLQFYVGFDSTGTPPINGQVYYGRADVRKAPGYTAGVVTNPPPPELRNWDDDFHFCLRYYFNSYWINIAGASMSGTAMAYEYALPVPMRTTPGLTVSGTQGVVNLSQVTASCSAQYTAQIVAYGSLGVLSNSYGQIAFNVTAEL